MVVATEYWQSLGPLRSGLAPSSGAVLRLHGLLAIRSLHRGSAAPHGGDAAPSQVDQLAPGGARDSAADGHVELRLQSLLAGTRGGHWQHYAVLF